MKRSSAVFLCGVSLTVAGCALIIDLGDEPKLAPAADGSTPPSDGNVAPVNEGGTADSGPKDAGPSGDSGPDAAKPACGLDDSPREACWQCVHATKTCDVSKECAAEPGCAAGLDCIKHCLSQSDCVNDCTDKEPTGKLFALTTQISTDCGGQCVPAIECQRLGSCAFPLPSNAIFRVNAEQAILRLDESGCKDIRTQIREQGVADAAACFVP